MISGNWRTRLTSVFQRSAIVFGSAFGPSIACQLNVSKPGSGLRDSRDLGHRRGALRAGDSDASQLVRLHVRIDHHRAPGEELDLPAHDIDQRGPLSLVRDVRHPDPGGLAEELGGEVDAAPGARGTVVELARIRLGVGNQLRDAAIGTDGWTDDQLRRRSEQDDGRHVIDWVVGELIRHGACRVAARHHEHGVAVRDRSHARFDPDHAARAGTVVEHDRLLEGRGELRSQPARHPIDRPAGWKRQDQPDRLGRITLRNGRCSANGAARRGKNSERRCDSKMGWNLCLPDLATRRACGCSSRAGTGNPPRLRDGRSRRG